MSVRSPWQGEAHDEGGPETPSIEARGDRGFLTSEKDIPGRKLQEGSDVSPEQPCAPNVNQGKSLVTARKDWRGRAVALPLDFFSIRVNRLLKERPCNNKSHASQGRSAGEEEVEESGRGRGEISTLDRLINLGRKLWPRKDRERALSGIKGQVTSHRL